MYFPVKMTAPPSAFGLKGVEDIFVETSDEVRLQTWVHAARAGYPMVVYFHAENPANYLRYRHSTIPEADFLGEPVRRSGCGLLCDVNNIFVTCSNLGLNAETYLEALPAAAVGEIHIAGTAASCAAARAC